MLNSNFFLVFLKFANIVFFGSLFSFVSGSYLMSVFTQCRPAAKNKGLTSQMVNKRHCIFKGPQQLIF